MEGAHDLGGMDGFGPVVTPDSDRPHEPGWELRAQILTALGVGSARPWIERLDPATYLSSPYYGRWLAAAELGTVSTGTLSREDLDRWRVAIEGGAAVPVASNPELRDAIRHTMTHVHPMARAAAPRFAVGDEIVVARRHDPVNHHRCPRYVRGVRGRIERICGDAPATDGPAVGNPEAQYTVCFASMDLWGAQEGEAPFSVLVDLFEHYLEPA